MVKVTRNEAAARLKVSKSTLDRMIKRGELTETEQHGQRHTVWVLMDDEIEDIAEVSTGNTNGHFPEVSEHIGDETRAANLALEGEVSGLRDLVEAVPRKTDRLRLALPGAYGTIQYHDEGPAHGARGTSPSETPGTLQLATKQATAGQGGRTGNFLRIRLTERNPGESNAGHKSKWTPYAARSTPSLKPIGR